MTEVRRLFLVRDRHGDICKLAYPADGVLYDPVTGTPISRFTKKWNEAFARLLMLPGRYGRQVRKGLPKLDQL